MKCSTNFTKKQLEFIFRCMNSPLEFLRKEEVIARRMLKVNPSLIGDNGNLLDDDGNLLEGVPENIRLVAVNLFSSEEKEVNGKVIKVYKRLDEDNEDRLADDELDVLEPILGHVVGGGIIVQDEPNPVVVQQGQTRFHSRELPRWVSNPFIKFETIMGGEHYDTTKPPPEDKDEFMKALDYHKRCFAYIYEHCKDDAMKAMLVSLIDSYTKLYQSALEQTQDKCNNYEVLFKKDKELKKELEEVEAELEKNKKKRNELFEKVEDTSFSSEEEMIIPPRVSEKGHE